MEFAIGELPTYPACAINLVFILIFIQTYACLLYALFRVSDYSEVSKVAT